MVIRRATGLSIRIAGNTATVPSTHYGSARVAGRWPPVLVAFVWPEEHLLADPGSSAETTLIRVSGPHGEERYVSGSILLNASQNNLYGGRAVGGLSRVRLFEHELAHLVGLSHVGDRGSLMYPTILPRAGLTVGDRRGLMAVGPSGRRGARCPNDLASQAIHGGAADNVKGGRSRA
jgi:hypothetical protein